MAELTKSIVKRLIGHLRSQFRLKVTDIAERRATVDNLDLRDVTAGIVLGLRPPVFVTLSLDREAIEQLTQLYTDGIRLTDSEKARAAGETACDILNVVLGNATADATDGPVGLSPPVLVRQSALRARVAGAPAQCLSLSTAFGAIDVHVIGPHGAIEPNLIAALRA